MCSKDDPELGGKSQFAAHTCEKTDMMVVIPMLMERIQSRESAAMGELYVLCHAQVLRYVTYLVKDEHQARDITQDVFSRIWRYASAYDKSKSLHPMAWINQVARNQVLTFLAREKKRNECGDEQLERAEANDTDDEQAAKLTISSPAFVTAMDALAPGVRQVIRLRFLYEKSLAEITEIMDVSPGTVKTWLRRGLARLRTELEAAV